MVSDLRAAAARLTCVTAEVADALRDAQHDRRRDLEAAREELVAVLGTLRRVEVLLGGERCGL